MEFMISRRAWVGDYLDPNTYLDMFVTDGENNSTGFSNAEYDKLIADAAKEPDAAKRMKMLEQAERILMDEMPIIPIYYYVSRNMVKPHVRGCYNNLHDDHPLRAIWIDPTVDDKDPHPNEYMGSQPVTWFIVRRLIGMVVTLWVVFTVSFLLMRVPGGPFSSDRQSAAGNRREHQARATSSTCRSTQQYLEPAAKRAVAAIWAHAYRLARLQRQRSHRARAADFGGARAFWHWRSRSRWASRPASCRPLYRGSMADVALMSLATVGIALPSFVVAGLAIMLFVFMIPIFPAAGWGSFRQLVLPAICLGALYAADIARITRTGMLDALSQDYIRTARAKGLSQAAVVLRHALPGALLPVVSFLGPAVGRHPHRLGRDREDLRHPRPGLALRASRAAARLHARDGLVLLYTVLLYTMNFLVDLSYAILDPRVELK